MRVFSGCMSAQKSRMVGRVTVKIRDYSGICQEPLIRTRVGLDHKNETSLFDVPLRRLICDHLDATLGAIFSGLRATTYYFVSYHLFSFVKHNPGAWKQLVKGRAHISSPTARGKRTKGYVNNSLSNVPMAPAANPPARKLLGFLVGHRHEQSRTHNCLQLLHD